MGGFGSGVLELLAGEGVRTPVRVLGIPDQIFEQASQGRLRELAGLTPHGIVAAVQTLLGETQSPATMPAAVTVPAQPVLADAGA